MTGRMRIMAGVFGVMVAYVGVDRVLQSESNPLEWRRKRTVALQNGIDTQRANLAKLLANSQKVTVWEEQSLPPNTDVARSLYQAWLLELVEHVDFEGPSVSSTQPIKRSHFHSLTFTVRGRGTLHQLTKFLFEFYEAGHLHQMRSIGITPISKSDHLDLTFSIEALALENAIDAEGKERFSELSSKTLHRLASRDPGNADVHAVLEDYEVIADRNLFDVGGALDATEHTYFDAVVSIDGENEAWFTLRSLGVDDHQRIMIQLREDDTWFSLRSLAEQETETLSTDDVDETNAEANDRKARLRPGFPPRKLQLREGDRLRIGSFVATVEAIEESDMVLRSRDSRWLLTIGEKLTEAIALPPEF